MPKYRQLHTKVIDSGDFNDMPTDFIRVFWLLLPLKCDSAGRIIDDPHYLRSVLFPRRRDVETEDIEEAVAWVAERGMVTRYQVGTERVLSVNSWEKYQKGIDREAESYLPPPPKVTRESVKSRSRVHQEPVTLDKIRLDKMQEPAAQPAAEIDKPQTKTAPPSCNGTDKPISATRQIQSAFEQACGYPVDWAAGNGKAAKWLADHEYSPAQVSACYAHMKAQPFWRDKTVGLPSIVKQIGEFAKTHPAPDDDGIDYQHFGLTPSGKMVRVQ